MHTSPETVETAPPPVPSTPLRNESEQVASLEQTSSLGISRLSKPAHSPRYDSARVPTRGTPSNRGPPEVTESMKENLEALLSQPPFYATIHIHARPYLVTVGDSVRLPFLMHGVMPGDVLRLDRLTSIGSRDWTIVGGHPARKLGFTPQAVVGATSELGSAAAASEAAQSQSSKKRLPPAYLDDRFFICRATVLGTESEPLRTLLKTKRRQRHVQHIKSKHRYTVLRISEITPKSVEEIEAGEA